MAGSVAVVQVNMGNVNLLNTCHPLMLAVCWSSAGQVLRTAFTKILLLNRAGRSPYPTNPCSLITYVNLVMI